MPFKRFQTTAKDQLSNAINILKHNIHFIDEEFKGPLHNKGVIYEIIRNYSEIVDDFIIVVANILSEGRDKAELPTIIATGGYGRSEMAPHSDIDLLFLSATPLTLNAKKFVKEVCDTVWQAKFKLGHSVRTLDEVETSLGTDLHFLTSLLERRHIWGARSPYKQIAKMLEKNPASSSPGIFVAAKLAERDNRHKKMGDTRYQLEPNIKESKGGLRDIQTLLWLTRFLHGVYTPEDLTKKGILSKQEAETLRKATTFFWEVRCRLHLITDRADDRLTFDVQPEIAKQMGYRDKEAHIRAEQFMKDYFLMANETGHLTRILCAGIEANAQTSGNTAGTRVLAIEDNIEGFTVDHNRLTVSKSNYFKDNATDIIRIYQVSQTSGLDIHPDALRYLRNALKSVEFTKESFAIFFKILTDPRKAEQTLRRMNEAGVLVHLIPDFANIHAHMQYDMYHYFTADEHTLRAVGLMHALENGTLRSTAPLATELFEKIKSRRTLYAAMFLHDIAKGTGGKHSEKGAAIARKICPKFSLNAEETETVAWLVENHLLMTMTAFKRDLNDNKTIIDFCNAVQSPERLKLLTILTTADIMAVGPERWNNWKSGLLSDLYRKSRAYMAGTPLSDDADHQHVMNLKKTRRLIGDNKKAFDYLSEQSPPAFWLAFSPEDSARFVAFLSEDREKSIIHITPDAEKGYTEVFVYTPDKKGLFATLSGAMAASGASIADARIFTLHDGMALDVFHIQNLHDQAYDNTTFLQKTLRSALAGNLDMDAEIAERQKNIPRKSKLFPVAPRVIIDNDASVNSTLIEVNGKDRPGFLYDITSTLTQQGLHIIAAKITTFGSRAVDVFYVKDGYGLKVLHPEKLANIEKNLKISLENRN